MTPNGRPLRWFLDRGDGCDGPDVPVEIEHLGNIHFVNMVRAEHREIIGVLVFNEVHILETASAVPIYQFPPVRICAGTGSMYWPSIRLRFHPDVRCLISDRT